MVTLFKAEAELFEDIRLIGWGELLNVECLAEGKMVSLDLSPNDKILFELLQNGTRYFHAIGIHNGQPAYVIIEGRTGSGHSFRKKIKIS